MKAEILLETPDLIFYNKPSGMLVIPDRFDEEIPVLKKIAEQYLGKRAWVLHRIDKGTSGVVVVAKNEQAHKFYSNQFQQHEVIKYYDVLAHGNFSQTHTLIELPIIDHPVIKGKMIVAKKGKPSKTEVDVVQQWALFAHLRVRIYTGRTHQIRVHLSNMGHPVLVDNLYGNGRPFYLSNIKKGYKLGKQSDEEKPLLNRLALHAQSLTLTNEDQQPITATAPLPKDLRAVIAQLNKVEKN